MSKIETTRRDVAPLVFYRTNSHSWPVEYKYLWAYPNIADYAIYLNTQTKHLERIYWPDISEIETDREKVLLKEREQLLSRLNTVHEQLGYTPQNDEQ